MIVPTVTRSLTGAAQLFVGRREGLSLLDRTVNGFWQSFLVILLILPINAVTVFSVMRAENEDSFAGLFVGQLGIVAVDWVMFPLLLALAAGPLGVSANYVSYVVARNWAAPIAAAILAIPFVLQGAGWVPMTGAAILSLFALMIALRYHYLILRIALQATVPIAIGLIVADLLLTLLIIRLFG